MALSNVKDSSLIAQGKKSNELECVSRHPVDKKLAGKKLIFLVLIMKQKLFYVDSLEKIESKHVSE